MYDLIGGAGTRPEGHRQTSLARDCRAECKGKQFAIPSPMYIGVGIGTRAAHYPTGDKVLPLAAWWAAAAGGGGRYVDVHGHWFA